MLAMNKPCNMCGVVDVEIQFFLPPLAVTEVYKKLMLLGEVHSATMFLAVNKHSFACFCVKCWVTDFVKGAMLDDRTSDEEKKTLINNHFAAAQAGYDEDLFWSKLGKPELN